MPVERIIDWEQPIITARKYIQLFVSSVKKYRGPSDNIDKKVPSSNVFPLPILE